MKAVADMVTSGGRVCDIGCDHALVSIYLAANGISRHVIASDVRTGPCEAARENIALHKVSDKVELRLGYGLDTIEAGEADTIIIAGMGGMLMTDILERGLAVFSGAKQLVLQPQSDVEHVRRFVCGHGWHIQAENMVKDAGKYYVIINAACKDAAVADEGRDAFCHTDREEEIYYKYGYHLIREKNAVLAEYLTKKRSKYLAISESLSSAGTEGARERLEQLRGELSVMDRALELMRG